MAEANSAKRVTLSDEDWEKLIEFVRKNPILYDPGHLLHVDNTKVKSVWAKIVAQMGIDGLTGEYPKKNCQFFIFVTCPHGQSGNPRFLDVSRHSHIPVSPGCFLTIV